MKVFRLPAVFLAVLIGILVIPMPDVLALVLIGCLFVVVLWLLPKVGPGGCGCNRGKDGEL